MPGVTDLEEQCKTTGHQRQALKKAFLVTMDKQNKLQSFGPGSCLASRELTVVLKVLGG